MSNNFVRMREMQSLRLDQHPVDAGDGDAVARGELFDFRALLGRDVVDRFCDGEGRDLHGVVAGFGSEREGVLKCPTLKDFVTDRELHLTGFSSAG